MRYGTVEFDSTIRGGLPVLVYATIFPAEPDVGIFSPQVEIEDIFWQPRRGKYNRKAALRSIPQKLFDQAMENDRESLEHEALEV